MDELPLKKENARGIEVVEEISAMIKKEGCWSEIFEHQPVRTSLEASQVRSGYGLEQGAEAIIVRAKKIAKQDGFAMLVLPGNLKFDSRKTKKILKTKDLNLASPDEVAEITGGVLPGGIPPLGKLFGLKTYVDEHLLNNEKIIFNAGDKRISIALETKSYLKLCEPEIVSLAS